MRRHDRKTSDLRAQLNRALQAKRFTEALELFEMIENANPDEPRWPHRKADLLRRMGRKGEAVAAYERAVDLYARRGFFARAAATWKLVNALDPSKSGVRPRFDPNAMQELD